MITCVDTNVLSALLRHEPGAEVWAGRLLDAKQRGEVLIHASVHAELLAAPGMTPAGLARVLSLTGVQVDWNTTPAMWERAGLAYAAYGERRRRSGATPPRRLLVDFLIGAHASGLQATLFTLDPQSYRLSYPALTLVS